MSTIVTHEEQGRPDSAQIVVVPYSCFHELSGGGQGVDCLEWESFALQAVQQEHQISEHLCVQSKAGLKNVEWLCRPAQAALQ